MCRKVEKMGNSYYTILDTSVFEDCRAPFPCNEDGSTLMNGYGQMGTQNLRECPSCYRLQEWVLSKGKQGFLHKVDHELGDKV